MYSPEMRSGAGLGNDRELLHMLTMDTGKSQKGHGGHQENIHLPETEGNLRLGFPVKHPTLKRRGSLGGGRASRPRAGGTAEDAGQGREHSFGERARIPA